MDKIEKLLRKISSSDRLILKRVLMLIMNKEWDFIDIIKVKASRFYRARKGKFRIIFELDENKEVVIYSVRLRNEKTYKF